MNRNFRETGSDRIFNIFSLFFIIILNVLYLWPLIFIVSASLSDPTVVWDGKVFLLPKGFSIGGYINILKYDVVWIGYRNTIIYTVLGTIINIFLTIIAAYPLSRKDFWARNKLMSIYTVTMFFGGGLIPTYLLIKQLGMLNTIWAMIIPGAVSLWNIIITRTYFQTTLPWELWEASQLDGCSDFTYLFKVVVPLSKPIIAVMALYYGIGHWNAFFNAIIYLTREELFPLQVFLRDVLVNNQFNMELVGEDVESAMEKLKIAQSMKYSIIIVSTVPVLCIYPFVQKHFIKGIMVGAIKG